MSRFNTVAKKPSVTNLAGGAAYGQSPELELASLLLTSFASNQFYRSAEDQLLRLEQLINLCDTDFAAKALIYARREMGMRSITHAGASFLAAKLSGTQGVSDFYGRIVFRADDITEILAFHKSRGQKVSKAMKKGLGAALARMDGYSLAKYKGEGKGLKMVDAVNILHPKHTEALKQLVEGTLPPADTWETALSAAGSNMAEKALVWGRLITEGKLGYLALLRNIRNISEQTHPWILDRALETLVDPTRIRMAKVFPHQFLTAYKQFKGDSPTGRVIREALSTAAKYSLANVEALELPGYTLVAVDNSGSMTGHVSGNSGLGCSEAGALLGIALAKSLGADIMEFGDTARYIPYDTDENILRFAESFPKKNKVGHGTNFGSVFSKASRHYDRIVILSDMQSWIGSTKHAYMEYVARTRSDRQRFIYNIDLRGYGTSQLLGPEAFQLAGFSDKIFELMGALEKGGQGLVYAIKNYKF